MIGFVLVVLAIFAGISVLSKSQIPPAPQNNSKAEATKSFSSTGISPLSPENMEETLDEEEFFGYVFKIPPGLTDVNILDPTTDYTGPNEVCLGHKDDALPVTHQVVIDVCARKIDNETGQTAVAWIERSSEIAGLLEYYKQESSPDEVTWSTLKNPAGEWYVASHEVTVDSVRYYAYLFDGEIILQVYTYDKNLLKKTLNSFKLLN